MCNACGMLCCGLDWFSGCGCDGCHDPDCWSDDDDGADDYDPRDFMPSDDPAPVDSLNCCAAPRRMGAFECS